MAAPHRSLNRIDARFARLRETGRKAFVAYITAGDPNLDTTARLAQAFERADVDVLELGVPFSDPLADGVVNQLAAERALKAGTTLAGVLRTVARLRREGLKMPMVLFTYFNPIHRYGIKRFVCDAARAGVDGVLNLDLPPEESAIYVSLMRKAGVHPIHLVAPTTDRSRMADIAAKARGFIYYVSREGVTGMRKSLATGVDAKIHEIQSFSNLPIVVGFGISTPQQVRAAAAAADGCVVGSAIVHRIGELNGQRSLVNKVTALVQSLIAPLRNEKRGRNR